jgi:hypothetical protein
MQMHQVQPPFVVLPCKWYQSHTEPTTSLKWVAFRSAFRPERRNFQAKHIAVALSEMTQGIQRNNQIEKRIKTSKVTKITFTYLGFIRAIAWSPQHHSTQQSSSQSNNNEKTLNHQPIYSNRAAEKNSVRIDEKKSILMVVSRRQRSNQP